MLPSRIFKTEQLLMSATTIFACMMDGAALMSNLAHKRDLLTWSLIDYRLSQPNQSKVRQFTEFVREELKRDSELMSSLLADLVYDGSSQFTSDLARRMLEFEVIVKEEGVITDALQVIWHDKDYLNPDGALSN